MKDSSNLRFQSLSIVNIFIFEKVTSVKNTSELCFKW